MAKLFRTVAETETLHAVAHFKTMGGVKSTAENLQAALDGETYEFTEMYPGFIRDAEEEGQKNAVRAFTFADEAEKVHGELYKKSPRLHEKGERFHLLPLSGARLRGGRERPDACPVCTAKKDVFITVA
ncbi:rubrerythrin family protein [Aminivibrio sp.]|uniref:rubrerythrin family protein n=1 Tax=Aminivibrio sp. TaxID=1872489 RepID=UPI0025B90833|nr:rubrerythrin family protein [Aminivibrio sp.]